jgi:hypothetical protein
MFFFLFSSFGWNWDPWTDTCCPVPSNRGFGNTSTIAIAEGCSRKGCDRSGGSISHLHGQTWWTFWGVLVHNITQSLHTYFPYVPYFSWQTWETVARWYPKIGSRIPSNPSVGFFGGDLLRYDRQLRKWLGQHGARVVRGTQLPRNLGGKSQEWMVKYGKYHVNDHEWSRMTSNRWVGL